jgi:hypothetical protein
MDLTRLAVSGSFSLQAESAFIQNIRRRELADICWPIVGVIYFEIRISLDLIEF